MKKNATPYDSPLIPNDQPGGRGEPIPRPSNAKSRVVPGQGAVPTEAGWGIPGPGIPFSYTVLAITREGATAADILTVLAVFALGQAEAGRATDSITVVNQPPPHAEELSLSSDYAFVLREFAEHVAEVLESQDIATVIADTILTAEEYIEAIIDLYVIATYPGGVEDFLGAEDEALAILDTQVTAEEFAEALTLPQVFAIFLAALEADAEAEDIAEASMFLGPEENTEILDAVDAWFHAALAQDAEFEDLAEANTESDQTPAEAPQVSDDFTVLVEALLEREEEVSVSAVPEHIIVVELEENAEADAHIPVNPLTIFGEDLISWHRSDSGVTLSDDKVSAWADLSGNGLHAEQALEARRYEISTNTLNGKQVFALNDAAAGMLISDFPQDITEITTIFVFKGIGTASPYGTINLVPVVFAVPTVGGLALYGCWSMNARSSAATNRIVTGCIEEVQFVNTEIFEGTTYDQSAWVWAAASIRESSFLMRTNVNGGSNSDKTTQSVSNPIALNSSWGYWGGDVVFTNSNGYDRNCVLELAEVISVRRVITDGEKDALSQYMQRQWGL